MALKLYFGWKNGRYLSRVEKFYAMFFFIISVFPRFTVVLIPRCANKIGEVGGLPEALVGSLVGGVHGLDGVKTFS